MKYYNKPNTWFWSSTELYIAIILSFIIGLTVGFALTPPLPKIPETYLKG